MIMGDCKPNIPMVEEEQEEESLIAAAQNIVKALEGNTNLTNDARKILADLGSQLSSIIRVGESNQDESEKQLCEFEEQLNAVQIKVMNSELNQSMLWDCGDEEAYEYLRYVDEARKLTERLERLCIQNDCKEKEKENELLLRAHDVLQTAMDRLDDEFRYLLVQNRQPFEPEHMSFRSSEEDIVDEGSILSFGDDSVEEAVQRDSGSRGSEEYIIELVHPDVIPHLRCIANLMFDSNYGQECSQVFVSERKEALDDCLFILELEKLSIEDVMKMEWNVQSSKIRRWIRAIKIFVRIYLASEKWLGDQIFGEVGSVSSVCFAESSRSSMLQLLNFCEAIAIGPHQPEKLIRVLDMYEALADLIPEIDALYCDEAGSGVRVESRDILRTLGDCAKATFLEFEAAVASNISTNPFPGGGIHHLTRYVMNYLKALTDYTTTLNEVLQCNEEERDESSYTSHMAQHFRSLVSILECNLDDKSKLYKDEALGHVFLMNNIHYTAEKVKQSELRTVLGDDWIRKRNWKFQQHAMSYVRATWGSILSLLRDEGVQNPGSNSVSRTLMKERLQSFYLAFEEVYKNQTGWSIPDSQLREDLRISTSLKVIQAYRTFVGRHTNSISDKHIKYSADDLEQLLLDLFEGSPRSLHGSHRR
ncbi:PREDICTED: exocyst complex component EXO70B1-like [Ipomoea nil]|uniref:exocyst complex component EXO70B1-like n=1 Tax=Ipomoea nil TaxID=35883 RepID=UPI0009012946|nr:PREDICTED: exocyst complex component EXO70B1-like [Ipomoea nil]